MGLPFFFLFQLLEEQDKLLFLPIIFLLEHPLHQHFPPAKLMLHQLFKHKEQSLCCHPRAESAQLAGEDIALCSLPCTHHSLGNICSLFFFNEARFALWAKCHLQPPSEQWCVWWICCKIHSTMRIFLRNAVVSGPRKKPNKPQIDTEEATGVGKAASLYCSLKITWMKVPGLGLGGLDTDQARFFSQILL